ncbi:MULTISPECIES: YqzE family protein [unclassified Paenibacillus]|uniref:YqzE family protein n=1 Tax=unclassified Paenibacillus TaxID=185978 RepID=UPI0030FBA6AE
MASGDELIKYITERFVTYIDTPKEIRRQSKVKESWTTKWFGMIPFSVSLWREDISSKRKRKTK